MSLELAEKPQRVNLVRSCISSIRSYIKTRNLQSGQKLPSFTEWARMLNVSVLVVREAFRSLEALGFVDIQHGRGIFLNGDEEIDLVNFLSFHQSLEGFTAAEVIEARAMLDLVVLEACIARAGQKTVDELIKMEQEVHEDPETFYAHHRRFHQLMVEATGNQFLMAISNPLLNTFWALGPLGKIEWPVTDEAANHMAMIDAIRNRDFSNTRQLIDNHLAGLCSKYRVFPYLPEEDQPA